jgi:hypothetical protein
MSSLEISILILAVSAIVAVAAVNITQAIGRRRRLAASRSALAGESGETRTPLPRDEAAAAPTVPPAAVPSAPAGGNGVARVAASRGPRLEPRLGEFTEPEAQVEPAFDADAQPLAEDPSQASATTRGAAAEGGAASPATTAASGAAASGGAVSGAATPARAAGAAPVAPVQMAAARPLLSPVCDCIVTLPLDPPVRGERLISLTQGIRRAGGKPILVDAVPVGASEEDAVPLSPGASYWALRIGVLLANRSGPLNAMEYSDFVSSVQSVADQLSALADTPDMADAIARARDLDTTCAQLDAQIGLNVDLPEPFGPAQLAELAAALRLAERGGHRYAWLGPNGEVIFTLSLTDSPQRLCFLLDVPRTAESLEGWASMLDCAQKVAGHFGGRMVDDGGRPIQLESLGTIARQLAQRYQSLDAMGLPAGSPLALRVFN